MSWFELAIIAFIVLSIFYVVWRGGAANPESTGALGKKVDGISNKLTALSGRVGAVEKDFDELKAEAATTKDIARLEQLLNERTQTLQAKIAGHVEVSQRTNHSVDRIERMLIDRGLGK
jgi:outer membrane murein-binding lipoprotein Lpp